MGESTKQLDRRVAALEGQVAALLTAMAPIPETFAQCVSLCNQAASVAHDAVVTREVQIIDAPGQVVIRLSSTPEGRSCVQIVNRDGAGAVTSVDEDLFT